MESGPVAQSPENDSSKEVVRAEQPVVADSGVDLTSPTDSAVTTSMRDANNPTSTAMLDATQFELSGVTESDTRGLGNGNRPKPPRFGEAARGGEVAPPSATDGSRPSGDMFRDVGKTLRGMRGENGVIDPQKAGEVFAQTADDFRKANPNATPSDFSAAFSKSLKVAGMNDLGIGASSDGRLTLSQRQNGKHVVLATADIGDPMMGTARANNVRDLNSPEHIAEVSAQRITADGIKDKGAEFDRAAAQFRAANPNADFSQFSNAFDAAAKGEFFAREKDGKPTLLERTSPEMRAEFAADLMKSLEGTNNKGNIETALTKFAFQMRDTDPAAVKQAMEAADTQGRFDFRINQAGNGVETRLKYTERGGQLHSGEFEMDYAAFDADPNKSESPENQRMISETAAKFAARMKDGMSDNEFAVAFPQMVESLKAAGLDPLGMSRALNAEFDKQGVDLQTFRGMNNLDFVTRDQPRLSEPFGFRTVK
jgi:hypothetical protein